MEVELSDDVEPMEEDENVDKVEPMDEVEYIVPPIRPLNNPYRSFPRGLRLRRIARKSIHVIGRIMKTSQRT